MAQKTRKVIHITIELDVPVSADSRDLRKFTKEAIDLHRAELPQSSLLASTLPVTVLSYKEIA